MRGLWVSAEVRLPIPPLDAVVPTDVATATFALGCFWSPEARFGCAPGVVRTRVGYAGGTLKNPTYHHLGDHTETIQLDYDPARTSYQELLKIFWASHTPSRRSWERQYMSALFVHDALQQQVAQETKEREAQRVGGEIFTEIIPAFDFYLAEGFHQKYTLQRHAALKAEFSRMYPDTADFVASAAASRVNGYVGGYGTSAALLAELDGFGLSLGGAARLREIVRAAD